MNNISRGANLKKRALSIVNIKKVILASISSLKYIENNVWFVEDVDDMIYDIKECFEYIYTSVFGNLENFDDWYDEEVVEIASQLLKKRATKL